MKTFLSVSFIVVWLPTLIYAQDIMSTTPSNQVLYIFGIPLDALMPIILAILGAAWAYWKRNEAKVAAKTHSYIEESVDNELLEKALIRTSDAFLKACEMTFQDLIKDARERNADGNFSKADINGFHAYAKAKAKAILPATIRNTLKKHGLNTDEFYLSEIKRAVRKLKNDHKIATNGSGIKDNVE